MFNIGLGVALKSGHGGPGIVGLEATCGHGVGGGGGEVTTLSSYPLSSSPTAAMLYYSLDPQFSALIFSLCGRHERFSLIPDALACYAHGAPPTTDILAYAHTVGLQLYALGDHYACLLTQALQRPYHLDAHPSIIHVRILVITPSDHIVQLLANAVSALAKSCHHDVAAVTMDTACADASIIIGTPGTLTRMFSLERKEGGVVMSNQSSSFEINNLQALIVDDFSGVLKEINRTPESHTALRQILRTSGVNKVVVSDKFSAEDVKTAATLLNTSLTEVIGKGVTTSVRSVITNSAELSVEHSEEKASRHHDTINQVTDRCEGAPMSSPSRDDNNRIRVASPSVLLQAPISISSKSFTLVESPQVLTSNQHFSSDSPRMKVSAGACSEEVHVSHTTSSLSKEKSSQPLKRASSPSAPISYSSSYMSSLASQRYSVSKKSTKEYYSGSSSSKENTSSSLHTKNSSSYKSSSKPEKNSSSSHRKHLYEATGKCKDSASSLFSEKHKSSCISKKVSPSEEGKHSNVSSSSDSSLSRKNSSSSSRHSLSLSRQSSHSSASRRRSPSPSSRHSPSLSSRKSSSSSVFRRHSPSPASRQSSSSSRRHSALITTVCHPSHLNSEKEICTSYHKKRYRDDDNDSHLQHSKSLSPSSEREKPSHKRRSSCKSHRSSPSSSHKCKKRHTCKKHKCKKQRCSSCCKRKYSSHSASEISQPSNGILLETSEITSSKGTASSMNATQPSTGILLETSETTSSKGTASTLDATQPSTGILLETSETTSSKGTASTLDDTKPSTGILLETSEITSSKGTSSSLNATQPSTGILLETSETTSSKGTASTLDATQPSTGILLETSEITSSKGTASTLDATQPSTGILLETSEITSSKGTSSSMNATQPSTGILLETSETTSSKGTASTLDATQPSTGILLETSEITSSKSTASTLDATQPSTGLLLETSEITSSKGTASTLDATQPSTGILLETSEITSSKGTSSSMNATQPSTGILLETSETTSSKSTASTLDATQPSTGILLETSETTSSKSTASTLDATQPSTGILLETSETTSNKGTASTWDAARPAMNTSTSFSSSSLYATQPALNTFTSVFSSSLDATQPALNTSTSVSSQHSQILSSDGDQQCSGSQILPPSNSPPPCENCSTEADPSNTKEFLKLEAAMLKEHKAEYQVYLDVPEFHPEYRNSYRMFLQYYQERFEKGDDQQKESMWKEFWQELLAEAEGEAWQQKRQDLVKQLESELIKRKERCTCKKKKATEVVEAEDASSLCHPLEGSENNPQGSLVLTNNQSFSPIGISLPGITRSTDICLASALTLLEEVCDSLGGLFGSLIKKVIKEIENLGNTKAAFLYLGERDTVTLLKMTTDKLRQVSITAQESQKIKLLYCCDVVEKLIAHVTDH